MLQKIRDNLDVKRSTKTSMNEIIKLTDSRHDKKLKNYKSLMMKKVVKTKKKSQMNDIIEKKSKWRLNIEFDEFSFDHDNGFLWFDFSLILSTRCVVCFCFVFFVFSWHKWTAHVKNETNEKFSHVMNLNAKILWYDSLIVRMREMMMIFVYLI